MNLDTCKEGQRLTITTFDRPLMVAAGAGGDHEGAVEGGDGKALALFAGIEIHASLPGQS